MAIDQSVGIFNISSIKKWIVDILHTHVFVIISIFFLKSSKDESHSLPHIRFISENAFNSVENQVVDSF